MTFSSTSSITSTINSLLSGSSSTNASNASNTSTASGTYSQLKTALDEAIASGSGSALPLYRSLVTLSQRDNDSATTASQTYNAKGLLTALSIATTLNDPLLQTEEKAETTGLPGNTANSTSLSALYAAISRAGNEG